MFELKRLWLNNTTYNNVFVGESLSGILKSGYRLSLRRTSKIMRLIAPFMKLDHLFQVKNYAFALAYMVISITIKANPME